jgi:hypothetical protein
VGKRIIRSRGDLDGEREYIRTLGGLLLRDLVAGISVPPYSCPTTKGGASAPTPGPTAPGGDSGGCCPTFITVGGRVSSRHIDRMNGRVGLSACCMITIGSWPTIGGLIIGGGQKTVGGSPTDAQMKGRRGLDPEEERDGERDSERREDCIRGGITGGITALLGSENPVG